MKVAGVVVALIFVVALPLGTLAAPPPPAHLPVTRPLTPNNRAVGTVYRAVNGPSRTVVDITAGARDGLENGAIGHICDRWEVKIVRVTRTRSRGYTAATQAQIKRCPEVVFQLD